MLCCFEPGLTLIFTSLGASFLTSVSSRSPKPGTRDKKETQSAGDREVQVQDVGLAANRLQTFDQRRPSAQHDGGEERASEVHVGLLDGVRQHLVDARALVSDQVGSEEQLRRSEPGRPDLGETRRTACGEFERPSCRKSVRSVAAGLTFKVLPSGRTYWAFSVSRVSSFCGLRDR